MKPNHLLRMRRSGWFDVLVFFMAIGLILGAMGLAGLLQYNSIQTSMAGATAYEVNQAQTFLSGSHRSYLTLSAIFLSAASAAPAGAGHGSLPDQPRTLFAGRAARLAAGAGRRTHGLRDGPGFRPAGVAGDHGAAWPAHPAARACFQGCGRVAIRRELYLFPSATRRGPVSEGANGAVDAACISRLSRIAIIGMSRYW